MTERRQEKIGWIGGWAGGFLWVLILSAVFAAQGKTRAAAIGVAICVVAVGSIGFLSPWRHPQVTYRALMLPIYALVVAALAWAVWSFGGLRGIGVSNGWGVLIVLPALIPLWTAGGRRWADGQPPRRE